MDIVNILYMLGGDIHTQVATLNINMTFGGRGGGVVDFDARIVAK